MSDVVERVAGAISEARTGNSLSWRHYIAEAQAAIAAMQADAAPRWMPIDTAPQDGTPILAYGPMPGCNARERGWNEVRETKWKCYPVGSPGYAKWQRGEGPIGIGWDWYESVHNWSHSWQPTHWMPLPAPPVADRVSTSSPVDDRGSGNTSDKLRDAVEVYQQAYVTWVSDQHKDNAAAYTAAAAVIEADRAALVAAIVAWLRGMMDTPVYPDLLANELEASEWRK